MKRGNGGVVYFYTSQLQKGVKNKRDQIYIKHHEMCCRFAFYEHKGNEYECFISKLKYNLN